VIHVSRHLDIYLREIMDDELLRAKPRVALGGIVPNLLRSQNAMSYTRVLDSLSQARNELAGKKLHIFGLGGTATVHLAALLGIDSADSSGWRNRAARGIIQLPGRGDRIVANLGSWRGRQPTEEEWALLDACPCPACRTNSVQGVKLQGIEGFCNRATHNLWTLLVEDKQVTERLSDGQYESWYGSHLDNSTYRPLIEYVLKHRRSSFSAQEKR
jgi:queuine/archaeosine tRNA-ribosyltransferase